MLCYLRHPGRPLGISERPPAALVSFVARQIDVRPETIADYLSSEQNRRRHAAELQNRLRLRPFGRRPAAELASWLLPHAIENDRLAYLAELVMEEFETENPIKPRENWQWQAQLERELTAAKAQIDSLVQQNQELTARLERIAALA